MKLKYPKPNDMLAWNNRSFPGIMLNATQVSNYDLIGLAEAGTDVYIAFCNYQKDQVWIEKTTKLLGLKGMYAQSFQKIETDEEFDQVYRFFVEQGILDGIKSSRENL